MKDVFFWGSHRWVASSGFPRCGGYAFQPIDLLSAIGRSDVPGEFDESVFPAVRRLCVSGGALACVLVALLTTIRASALELGLPADCTPGKDCFVQQLPDMEPGSGATDPFCGSATYDGHSGTDIRLLSLSDVQRRVAVRSMADGTVLRQRDGQPDRLVLTARDRQTVGSMECGNGVLIDHGEGIEIQYCHLRQGSIAVQPGDRVHAGDRIGEIGASGLAQFPHVHVTVRRQGEVIDPFTGRALVEGCSADAAKNSSLFSRDVAKTLARADAQLVGLGLSDGPIDHASLTAIGTPPVAHSDADAIVAWAWFLNLRGEDRIRLELRGPTGELVAADTTKPMDRNKASFSAYVGKRRTPTPGTYSVSIILLREGKVILEQQRDFVVQ